MKLVNFDLCERPNISLQKHYGGQSGNKEHIIIDGENYFLKYPKKISSKNNSYTNVILSYTTSPLSEYMGSKIYEILGEPVHKTILGVSKKLGHTLVACKDFLKNGDQLDEFKNIKVSYAPVYSEKESSSGENCNLDEVLEIIKTNPFLNSVKNVEEHFWDMFVIDAFIGNADRNNGNWGIIRHLDGSNTISPVYDNGNSFNNKWDIAKFEKFSKDEEAFYQEAYKGKTCIFTHTNTNGEEKVLNPFKIIASGKFQKLNESICRIVPRISEKKEEIVNFINDIPNTFLEIPIISNTQKNFFINILRTRYNKVLMPTYKNIRNPTQKVEINFKSIQQKSHDDDISPTL